MQTTRIRPIAFRYSAALAAIALTTGATTQAQTLGVDGPARTVNERIATQTPPPINTDPSRPELNGVGAQGVPGIDSAILIEHAVDMAIEGSALLAIAGPASTDSTDPDPVKNLRNKGRKMMAESQTLLGQAAGDGRAFAANPVLGRFQSAANLYVTTLAGLGMTSPAQTAQVAMINEAVKDVLDSDHIQQMSKLNTGSPALQRLKLHAVEMKTQGLETLRRMVNEGASDPAIPVNVSALATRGKQLLDIADELGRSMQINSAMVQPGLGNGNPGRFQSNRPEIIGGTYGTGSPRLGIYQGLDHPAGSTAPRTLSEPSTIPTNSNQTTGSTGGVKPQ